MMIVCTPAILNALCKPKTPSPFTIEADPIDEVMERGRKAFYEMRKTAAENGTAGMSLDEINEEIRLARRGE